MVWWVRLADIEDSRSHWRRRLSIGLDPYIQTIVIEGKGKNLKLDGGLHKLISFRLWFKARGAICSCINPSWRWERRGVLLLDGFVFRGGTTRAETKKLLCGTNLQMRDVRDGGNSDETLLQWSKRRKKRKEKREREREREKTEKKREKEKRIRRVHKP